MNAGNVPDSEMHKLVKGEPLVEVLKGLVKNIHYGDIHTKFSTLFEAKKYVRNSIAKKSRDWLKNNELAMDEIAKKLLDE